MLKAYMAGLVLMLVLLVTLLSSVELSLDYRQDRLTVCFHAFGGHVRRCFDLGRPAAGTAKHLKEHFQLPHVLTEGWRMRRIGILLLKESRIEELWVEISVGLGRADLTAWAVGIIWSVTGLIAVSLSRLVAPGSAGPRVRVNPSFEKPGFTLTVRGRVRVRVYHLLTAAWRAFRAMRRTKESVQTPHKLPVLGNIKPCRSKPAGNQ